MIGMEGTLGLEIDTVFAILDNLDYFQILKIGHDATEREIRAAYHRESRSFHPDRFLHLGDPAVGEKVLAIHKRITEAYTVLRLEGSRRAYLEAIGGPERDAHLRWTVLVDDGQRKEEVGTTENGRKLYGAALADLEAGRLEAAERNLRMALVFEPQNANYARKVEEVSMLRKASLQAGSLSST